MILFGKKRIAHPNAPFYQYVPGELFNPGAQSLAFEMRFGLPLLVYRGAGRIAGALQVTQQPQMWANLAVPISGFGGLQTGTFGFQPLYTPTQSAPPSPIN